MPTHNFGLNSQTSKHKNRYIQIGDNPELTQERIKASFDTDLLGALIYGGSENLSRRREITNYVSRVEELQDPKPLAFMTRKESIENAQRKVIQMKKHLKNVVDSSNDSEIYYYTSLVMGYSGHPLLVHDLFGPSAILSNANESQLKNWLPKVQNSEIIVTYAQTELGHGTNLKMLETTATYDPNTEQFEIHSPTITSTKFWPGNLGLSANYVILQAQLFTLGKCYGPHLFIVQIRDLDTHKALPGIRVGEIGPKFEDNLMDNGYLSFDHVRIPRTHMLMKHCQILNDGTYVKPKHSKLGYSTMVEVRAFLLGKNAMHIAQACTIAIRYSCIRRQGKIDPTKDIETKILEYQTQQFRIFPHLARAFAYLATGRRIFDFSRNVLKDIRSGHLGLINELHAISSGLKAVITFNTSLAIEQCRLACGGHGYSLASGLPQLYAIVVAECTYEGENLVMLLQMARYLMKKERTRIELKQDVNIFDELLDNDFCEIDASYKESLDMFKALANRKITDVYDRLEILKKQGKKEEYAWNECAVDLCRASRAYCRNFIAHIFVQYVNQIQEPTLRHLLEEILKLLLNFEITECSADLIEIGYMNGQKLVKVRNELNEVMKSIRVDAISIIDAFDFSDRELDSILGKRDGHVYESLLEWAQKSPLNEYDVLPFHQKYLGTLKNKKVEHSKL